MRVQTCAAQNRTRSCSAVQRAMCNGAAPRAVQRVHHANETKHACARARALASTLMARRRSYEKALQRATCLQHLSEERANRRHILRRNTAICCKKPATLPELRNVHRCNMTSLRAAAACHAPLPCSNAWRGQHRA
jgi:hypothetical protein